MLCPESKYLEIASRYREIPDYFLTAMPPIKTKITYLFIFSRVILAKKNHPKNSTAEKRLVYGLAVFFLISLQDYLTLLPNIKNLQ